MDPDLKQSAHFYNLIDWAYRNRRRLLFILALAAVLGAGVGIAVWRKGERESDASRELLAVPAPINTSGDSDPAPFLAIANKYPGTDAGERALILAAGIQFTSGKYADAQKTFEQFLARHENSRYAAEAALGVAASLESQGKIPEATTRYEQVLSRYGESAVAAQVKLTLGRLHEQQKNPEKAYKLYNELARSSSPENPSAWAMDAMSRRAELVKKFPNLAPATNAPPRNVPSLVNPPSVKPASNPAPAKPTAAKP